MNYERELIMHKLHYKILIFVLLIVVGTIIIFMLNNRKKESITKESNKHLALTIYGKDIFTSDINELSKITEVLHSYQLNSEELQKEVEYTQRKMIINEMRQVILDQQIEKYKLTVKEQEVVKKVEDMFRNTSPEQYEKAIDIANSIKTALQEWQVNPNKSDSIYEEKLSKKDISEDQWELYKITYNTPEKLKMMVIPKNIEEMKKDSLDSMKKELLYQKLMDIITKDITVMDDEVNFAYQKKYENIAEKPSLSQVSDEIRKSLLEEKKNKAINDWWKKQFQESKIEIKDPAYSDILDDLT